MKPPVLLLSASLFVNAALVVAFVLKPSLAPAAVRGYFQSSAAQKADHAALLDRAKRESDAEARRNTAEATSVRSRLWSSLDSNDLPTLVAHLRAAGFSPGVIRSIVSARIQRQFASRRKEIMGAEENQPYWKTDNGSGYGQNSKLMASMNQLYRERTKLMRDVLGDDFFTNGENESGVLSRQYGNLSKSKIDLVQRINDDYSEMTSQARAATQGIMLPEDRETLALLQREKHADLAAVLTPTELEDYEMRTSQVTSRLRQALTLMDATEDEFRAIYRVQQPFADQLNYNMGPPSPDAQTLRRAALEQIAAQLKTVLGEQRYAEYVRASNNEYQQLSRIAQSANIDTATAIRTFNLRDSVSQESNRIYNDTTMNADQKRGALQLLAQNTKTQIVSALGQTAGQAYLQTASRWLNSVESGGAVTFGVDGSSMNTRMLPRARPGRPASP